LEFLKQKGKGGISMNIGRRIAYLFCVFSLVALISCAGKMPNTLLGDGAPQTQSGSTVRSEPDPAVIPGGLSEAPPPLAGNPNPVAATAPSGVEETPVTTTPVVV
jgi:hypothetical protein